jgi:hypothetical protein
MITDPHWADAARSKDLRILRIINESDWFDTLLMPKYAPSNEAGCELWTRGTYRDGYGAVALPKAFLADLPAGSTMSARAHRVRWLERHRVPVPYGLDLDHLCDTPPCGSPEHLEPSISKENIRRARTGSHVYCRRKLHVIPDYGKGCLDCSRALSALQGVCRRAAYEYLRVGQVAYTKIHGSSILEAVRVAGMERCVLYAATYMTEEQLLVNRMVERGPSPNIRVEIATQAMLLGS